MRGKSLFYYMRTIKNISIFLCTVLVYAVPVMLIFSIYAPLGIVLCTLLYRMSTRTKIGRRLSSIADRAQRELGML